MRSLFRHLRHTQRTRAIIWTCIFVFSLIPQMTEAATRDVTLDFRPHCSELSGWRMSDDTVFGELPDANEFINIASGDGTSVCSRFAVEDPQTLITSPLTVGDILDVDIVVENPSQQHIKQVRAWLSYDPNILKGDLIEIADTFPSVTPGESSFSQSEGYAKLGASAEGDGPDASTIPFARLQFTVLKTTPTGSPISFHDVQPNGHSFVNVADGTGETYALGSVPGILKVVFWSDSGGNGTSSSTGNGTSLSAGSSSAATALSSSSASQQTDGTCNTNADCQSGTCINGICTEEGSTVPNGGSCTFNAECASGICSSGICVALDSNALPEHDTERTAFSLLQVRNLRVTTDGTTAFLAWDPLQSSQLKAYNVYYGTESGRYIQRKTVPSTTNSLTIRNLPAGTTYYFAVRAVSKQDEESAFSQEVAVTIGLPNTSTSPLLLGSIGSGLSQNPLGNGTSVPGETGIPSTLIFFLIASAVIGTFFASRRQLVVQDVDS